MLLQTIYDNKLEWKKDIWIVVNWIIIIVQLKLKHVFKKIV